VHYGAVRYRERTTAGVTLAEALPLRFGCQPRDAFDRVGYTVERIDLDAKVQSISATKVRSTLGFA